MDPLELVATIVTAAIEFPAAGQAGGGAPERASAREFASAMRADINITALQPASRKWQIVTARFAGDPEVRAGLAPLGSMRRDPPAAGPGLGEEMRQLMAQGAVHFRFAVHAETTVQEYARAPIFGAARRGPQPGGPFYHDPRGQSRRALLEEKITRQSLERRIATGRSRGEGRGERKFELAKRQHGAPVRSARGHCGAARCVQPRPRFVRFRERWFLCLTKSEWLRRRDRGRG